MNILNEQKGKQKVKNIFLFIIGLLLFVSVYPFLLEVDAKTKTIVTPSSFASTQTQVISLPNLIGTPTITTNTGTVKIIKIEGDKVTVQLMGGAYTGTTTTGSYEEKQVTFTATQEPYSQNGITYTPPSTMSASSACYSVPEVCGYSGNFTMVPYSYNWITVGTYVTSYSTGAAYNQITEGSDYDFYLGTKDACERLLANFYQRGLNYWGITNLKVTSCDWISPLSVGPYINNGGSISPGYVNISRSMSGTMSMDKVAYRATYSGTAVKYPTTTYTYSYVMTVNYQDLIAPQTPPVFVLSTTSFTNANIQATMNDPSDVGTPIVREYRIDNGSWKPYTGPIVVDKNGLLEGRVSNEIGYSPVGKLLIDTIDKEPPTAIFSKNPDRIRTNGSVKIEINGSDTGSSGFKRIKLPDNTYTTSSVATYTVSVNGEYVFEVEDFAGNIKTERTTVQNINEHSPHLLFGSVNDVTIGKTLLFNIHADDLDAADDIPYTVLAGNMPGLSNYNTYLSATNGNRGTSAFSFSANKFPSAELAWNARANRFEKNIYLTTTISDGLRTENVQTSFIVFNHNPVFMSDLPNITGDRMDTDSIDLADYFTDADGHTLSYVVVSSDTLVADVSIVDKELIIHPKNVGTSTITVTARDGFGGLVSKSFAYTVDNNAPVVTLMTVSKKVVGANDKVIFKGTIADAESDNVTITAKLGSVLKSTTVAMGNGDWEIAFLGSEIEEGIVTNIRLTADDSYDTVTSLFEIPELTVDNTMPFFWAITHSPTKPTSGEVTIQLNVGDTYLGVKELVYPDGTKTLKVNSTYEVTKNGTYDFIVVDKAGNSYTQSVQITNIDAVAPVITVLTLLERADKTYEVTAKATDASGIESITLNNGTKLTKGESDTYQAVGISALPTYVTALDKAGNQSGNVEFLDMPTIDLIGYNAGGTQREDVKGLINGSGTLDFQIGSKKYSCAEKPCQINISKNTNVTVVNKTMDRATIKTISINNIDKKTVNLILDGVRNPENPNEITFSWDENLINPVIVCKLVDGTEKTINPDTNPFIFIGVNQTYTCKIIGELDGKLLESEEYSIFPDYDKEVVRTAPSDSYERKEIEFNTYVEKNVMGASFYINFHKNNTDEQVPIPSSLLK